MLDANENATLGTPHEDATHWTISRIVSGKPARLDHPSDDGVRVHEWELEERSVSAIRERWGAGTFKLHYHKVDPSAVDPKDRRRPMNAGPAFTLEAEPVRATVAAPVVALPVAPPAGGDMGAALQFATALMQMSDQRATATIEAVARLAGHGPAPAGGDPELRAELAGLRARLDADQRQREIEDRHRAELAERDRRIAELEADDGGDEEPLFQPGAGSLWEQLGYGILNAAAKRPELVGAVLGPILERMNAPAQSAAAAPSTPPPALSRAPQRPTSIATPTAIQAPSPPPADLSANAMASVPVVAANGTPRAPARAPAAVAPSPDTAPSSS